MEKHCRKLNEEDARDCSRWRKFDKGCLIIRMGVSGRMFLLVPANPTSPVQRAAKRWCVCVSFEKGLAKMYKFYNRYHKWLSVFRHITVLLSFFSLRK